MWWIASYTLANWSLILCVAAIVAALIAVTVFMRNWKAALAALVILAAGFAYQWIDKQGYQRRAAEELAEKLAVKDALLEAARERINILNAANELDAMTAIADAATISDLQAKASANETPPDTAIGLGRDAVKRVRDFRRQALGRPPAADKGRTAAGAGGHPKVLPWYKWGRRDAGP